jgi:ribosomal protein S27AE
MTNDQFLKEVRHRRNMVFLWTPMFFVVLIIIIPIIAIILNFSIGDIPHWLGILPIAAWLIGYSILERHVSQVPCPKCGNSAVSFHQSLFMKYLRCRKCGYQISGSSSDNTGSTPEEQGREKNWTFPGV